MVRRDSTWVGSCVLVDLNTQRDFCTPEGAAPVANLAQLVPALRRVVAWAKRNHAPLVSSLNSHRLYELEGARPDGCVEGSKGHRKLRFTIMGQHARVDVDNTLCVPVDMFRQVQQVVFRERAGNLLGNPKADRFLTQLGTDEFIVFGNGLERSIKVLVLGLLTREKPVTVVADACGYWDQAEADFALRQMQAKGARVITVDELRQRKLDRRQRYALHRPDASAHVQLCSGSSMMAAVLDEDIYLPTRAPAEQRNGNGRRNAHSSGNGKSARSNGHSRPQRTPPPTP